MTAVAYLRKSKVTSDRHVSWEVQEAEVRSLAARHGDHDLELLSDWSVSGRATKTHRRKEYARLRERIAAGEVSTVYSYSLSRLSRSLTEYASFAALCEAHGVRVRLCKEGEFDYSTASGRFNVGIIALLAQMEAELSQERAADRVKAQRAKGTVLGVAPYGSAKDEGSLVPSGVESIDAVRKAYIEAGSFNGAARILTAAGVPTRRAKFWSAKVVRDILVREKVVEPAPRQRILKRAEWPLFHLLRCPHDGTTMTAMDRRKPKYICKRGVTDPGHPRPYSISEGRLMPWVRAKAAEYRKRPMVMLAEQASDEVDSLLATKARWLEMYADGLLDKQERDRRLSGIDERIQNLEVASRATMVPDINWDWAPSDINEVLRAMWDHIPLKMTDDGLVPTEPVWLVDKAA